MFLHLVKEIKRLRKQTNGLLSKEMSYMYLKVIVEEKTDVLKTSIF